MPQLARVRGQLEEPGEYLFYEESGELANGPR